MTPDDEGARAESAEFDERIVAAIRDAPKPVVNTHYVVRALDRPYEELFERLERLAEAGALGHMEVRDRGHLWWLSFETELAEEGF